MKALLSGILVVGLLVACDTNTAALPTEGTLNLLAVEYEPGYLGTTIGVLPSTTSVDLDFAFPSTNQANFDNGRSHVVLNEAAVGSVKLDFTQPRNFLVCFEYRRDDEANTVNGDNPNTHISDGRWLFYCVDNRTAHGGILGETLTRTETISATSHVDIRIPFGGERDERFDWTRFYVMTETTKDDCKDGGWQALGFKNQGQCIASVQANQNAKPHN